MKKKQKYCISEHIAALLTATIVVVIISAFYFGEYLGVAKNSEVVNMCMQISQTQQDSLRLSKSAYENETQQKQQCVARIETLSQEYAIQVQDFNQMVFQKLCQPMVVENNMFMTSFIATCGENENATWIRVK